MVVYESRQYYTLRQQQEESPDVPRTSYPLLQRAAIQIVTCPKVSDMLYTMIIWSQTCTFERC